MFASLALERRLVFVCSDLSHLSAAVHAAAALLYPFVWQHIFVPLLPESLLDYLTAPMPFVVGIHASLLPAVRRLAALEDQLVWVDLDGGKVQLQGFDQRPTKFLPTGPLKRLRRRLSALAPSIEQPQFEHDATVAAASFWAQVRATIRKLFACAFLPIRCLQGVWALPTIYYSQ
eukprot:SAG31_NODE_2546_length_5531_cov_1.748159_4_plen_175_part_00